MNILLVATAGVFPSDGRPTAGIFLANFLRELCRRGHMTVVVTPVPWVPWPVSRLPMFAEHRLLKYHQCWNGLEVFRPRHPSAGRLGVRRTWAHARNCLSVVAPLCRSLHARHCFGIVIGNALGAMAHVAQSVAADLGLRCVSWAIGSDVHTVGAMSRENLRLLRHNVRHAELVLAVSDAIRQAICARCGEAPNVHTFYRGIELGPLRHLPDRAKLRAELGLAPDRKYMLSVGQAIRQKGVEEYYETFRRLSASRADLSAVWVGGGELAGQLRRRAEADGLARRLTLTGQVPRPTVLRYMRAADLMVFASHAEGLPNVVVEALGAGLPTVATCVGGTGEVVADGITGLLVPPGNAEATTRAASRLLDNPGLAAQLAMWGREYVRAHFDAARNADVFLLILRSVMDKGRVDTPIPPCAGVEPGQLPADALAENARAARARGPSRRGKCQA